VNELLMRPRRLALVCGAAAFGTGAAYMSAAGAPPGYLAVNAAALALGAVAWVALGPASTSRVAGAGPAILALAVLLLITALFGASVEGATRWVTVGPLNVQVSLVALPPMLVLYARRPDEIGTTGMVVAALALALQPDRAMSGALLAGLVAHLCARPDRLALAAVVAAVLAFGWALLAPDALPAVPYVERVLHDAFGYHPLAGAAVLAGAAALGVPALVAASAASDARPALLAFGATWCAVVAAAALGNYPTPLVGYGGSSVLGYLLSGALLPPRASRAGGPLRAA